jgi:hypothetical protein
MNTDVDLAWAAGFIDGEGCITLAPQNRPRNNTHASVCSVLIQVTQINRVPLDKLVALFGGYVGTMRARNARQGWVWQWRLHRASEVIPVLESVMPYLVLKRPEAEVVLAYARTVGCGYRRISREEIDYRFGLMAQLREIRDAA